MCARACVHVHVCVCACVAGAGRVRGRVTGDDIRDIRGRMTQDHTGHSQTFRFYSLYPNFYYKNVLKFETFERI